MFEDYKKRIQDTYTGESTEDINDIMEEINCAYSNGYLCDIEFDILIDCIGDVKDCLDLDIGNMQEEIINAYNNDYLSDTEYNRLMSYIRDI